MSKENTLGLPEAPRTANEPLMRTTRWKPLRHIAASTAFGMALLISCGDGNPRSLNVDITNEWANRGVITMTWQEPYGGDTRNSIFIREPSSQKPEKVIEMGANRIEVAADQALPGVGVYGPFRKPGGSEEGSLVIRVNPQDIEGMGIIIRSCDGPEERSKHCISSEEIKIP